MGAYEYAAGQDIAVSPSSLTFDDTAVGATTSLELVIANAGDQALSITAIALSDDTHFAVTVPALPATVTSGSHLTLTVDFTPAGAGLHNADLTISANDPDEALTGDRPFRHRSGRQPHHHGRRRHRGTDFAHPVR